METRRRGGFLSFCLLSSFLWVLFLSPVASAQSWSDPMVTKGMARTATETLPGPHSITVLKGDTVYFYAEAFCNPGGDEQVATADEIQWDSGSLPEGTEYDYDVHWTPGAPPQAPPEGSSEKWRTYAAFDTLGHHVLGVTVTREDPPPDWPGRPVQTTFF